MLFEQVTNSLLSLLLAGWAIFATYIVLRGLYALKGIEKSIEEIAQTLKTKG